MASLRHLGTHLPHLVLLASGAGCDVYFEAVDLGSTGPKSEASCLIAGVRWAAGVQDPANPCQECRPLAAPRGWTALADGSPCRGSYACEAGRCSGAAGVLDPAFGQGGFVTGPGFLEATESVGMGIALDSAERIVGAGFAVNAATPTSGRDLVVWRFIDSGEKDPTFGETGHFLENVAAFDTGFDVLVDSSDRVVVSGYEAFPYLDCPTLWRLTTSGTLDPTFDGDGKTSLAFDPEVQGDGLARDPTDGSYVLAGRQRSAYMVAVRFTSEGAIDTSFNSSGSVAFKDFPRLGRLSRRRRSPGPGRPRGTRDPERKDGPGPHRLALHARRGARPVVRRKGFLPPRRGRRRDRVQ
ncbi:MAG: delta-60 repeat domain-containing protein [Myxococcales bacterium]